MNRSASVGIKLSIFFAVTLLFVWGLIAYAGAHAKRTPFNSRDTDSFSNDRKKIEKTFTLKPGGSFELKTDLGDVSVEGWEKEEVFLSAEIRGDSRLVREFTLSFDTSAQRVVVIGKDENRDWFFGHWNDADVHFDVKVPTRCMVDVVTSGGNVRFATIQGDVHGATSGGSVKAYDLVGPTVLNTSGGIVEAKNINGSCEAKTSGGNVNLERITGNTVTHTSGGSIHLTDVKGRIDGSTSGGGVYARLIGSNEGVSLKTSGGSITIEVPQDISADLDAATSGGGVDCDLSVTVKGKMDDDELVGKINGGGNQIHLRTSGGSIHIHSVQ